jgi:sortase B
MKDKKSLFRWILLAAGVLLVAYGAIRLGGYLSEMNLVRNTTAELREAAATAAVTTAPAVTDEPAGTPEPLPETAVPAPAETAAPEEEPAVSATLPDVEYPNGYNLVPRIQELRKKSEYIIGWITMDDLDEPVVLKDNEFFLNHDAMGKRNSNGAIFMDEGTRLLTRPYTIMLYGHNMKSGMMFGNLRKYTDPTYCRKHRTLRFDTLYEEGQYEIFAVVTISVTPGKARYLNLWALRSPDRETRKNALAGLKRANSYVSTAEVSEEDQILLLITCVGDDDERLVVAAVRI